MGTNKKSLTEIKNNKETRFKIPKDINYYTYPSQE